MNWLKGSPDWLYKTVDWLVTNVENILIRATPVISPLPSAFASVHALTRAGWPYPWLMGFVIEGMGLCAGALIGYIETNNRKFPDRSINIMWGRGLFGFYVMLVVAVIAGYETLPNLISWFSGELSGGEVIKSCVPLLFPGLTLVGSIIVALRQYMKRNEDEFKVTQEQETDEHKALFALKIKHMEEDHAQQLELARMKVERKLSSVNLPVNKVETGKFTVDNSVKHRVLDVYEKNPLLSLRKAGELVGLSHTGVSKILDSLEAESRIERHNGDGVKVIR